MQYESNKTVTIFKNSELVKFYSVQNSFEQIINNERPFIDTTLLLDNIL